MVEKKTYRLKVKCANCGHRQSVVVPVKVLWRDGVIESLCNDIGTGRPIVTQDSGYGDKTIHCNNCNCPVLQKECR